MLEEHPVGQTVHVRIALVHYTLPPVIGGVESVVAQHAAILAKNGHEVLLISATPAPRDESGSIKRICIPELALRPELNAQTPTESAAEKVVQALEPVFDHQDIVFLHNVCTMPFNPALTLAVHRLSAALSRTRFVAWIHDIAAINPDYSIPSGDPWDLLRRAVPSMEYAVVSPLRQRQWCELTGLPSSLCTVVPNGVDPLGVLGISEELTEFAEKHHLLDREYLLLHPTRLLKRKNVEFSIEVTAALRTAGADAAMLITGAIDPHHAPSASYQSGLTELRNSLQLEDRVLFVGDEFETGPEKMPGLYALADAVFFPSKQEGFGLPMLEAAMHRLPCFCSDIEPIRDLPGAIPFPLGSPASAVADLIIQRMHGSPTNSPRKQVIRNYAWSGIYRKYLAPLLLQTNNRN